MDSGETVAAIKRRLVTARLDKVNFDLIAAELVHQSPRTLGRRLKESGVTFRELVDQERRRRVLVMLKSDLNTPTEQLLAATGQHPKSIFRSFKDWFGYGYKEIKADPARLPRI